MLHDIPVLSELNPYKMASSSSAVNDSVILTKDDIPGASLAGLNPTLRAGSKRAHKTKLNTHGH